MDIETTDPAAEIRADTPPADIRPSEAFSILAPDRQTVPVVFASPHSGRDYPAGFLQASQLDALALRGSEDAFIDELFSGVVDAGAPLISARFPRAYIDVNREPLELDPNMFADKLPAKANVGSPRVAAGLGTIARIVANGREIYSKPLTFKEAESRIETCYRPYHRALEALVERTLEQFGACLLVDCHSMPSGVPEAHRAGGAKPDIVIGDCWGSACRAGISEALEAAAEAHGFHTRRNVPYAGGFTTRHYGRPADGIDAIQIELRRDLYMDERTVARRGDMDAVQSRIAAMASDLCRAAARLLGGG